MPICIDYDFHVDYGYFHPTIMAELRSPDRTETIWPANPKIFTIDTF